MATEDDIIGPVPSIYVDRRIEIGKSIVISGVITPRGNYSGVIPVRIKINDGTTDSYISLNTDSQGYYSTEYTFQTIGVYTITAMVGSEVSNSKTIYCYSHYTSLTLSSDKNIIMAGERATITATLEDNGVPVSGKTVYFEVRKVSDDSLVESLSDVTDSAGVATVSYLGQGAGDIYIEADCMILSETYVIEDYLWIPKFNGTEPIKQIQGSTTV
ncbi:MAG: Ig-like domain-containing protein, partial [Methanobrevibacter sp.]|nr:Ig-like domain-containing protein [Methanobrevibacter sp.]